jgi:hypothetical protein
LDKTFFKLGSMLGESITPYRYSKRFKIEKTTGPDRLCIGAAEAQVSLLWKLAFSLPAPYYVLYVLHTSRCGSELGRYQSPALDFHALNGFMAEFCEFLTDDARHDLWIHSPESGATLVWDRHDLVYAYGPLERFRAVLKESLQEGNVDGPPYPHVHMYHAEYDDSERELLRHFEWSRSPLLAGDEQ